MNNELVYDPDCLVKLNDRLQTAYIQYAIYEYDN